jgi:hypothetical protein
MDQEVREARPTLWGFNPEESLWGPEEGAPIFPSLVQILQTGLHEDPPVGRAAFPISNGRGMAQDLRFRSDFIFSSASDFVL